MNKMYERKCRVDECESDAEFELIIKQIGNNFEKYRDEFCIDHYNRIRIVFDLQILKGD